MRLVDRPGTTIALTERRLWEPAPRRPRICGAGYTVLTFGCAACITKMQKRYEQVLCADLLPDGCWIDQNLPDGFTECGCGPGECSANPTWQQLRREAMAATMPAEDEPTFILVERRPVRPILRTARTVLIGGELFNVYRQLRRQFRTRRTYRTGRRNRP